ncbi:hypothetical protein ANCDUO_09742 [Ancylostoma duodenale]|uniref:Uncharacterized protein n=1 Tax=Ancylostoma duodenale TaxID=51022 RepID=A0A0C2GM26_9BILA|nr:hypothetical protein ANCDUO_09742 [Ancylostoma duodenale]
MVPFQTKLSNLSAFYKLLYIFAAKEQYRRPKVLLDNITESLQHFSALVENEDGTWGLREVSLQEYLRATPEERIEMGWWYGGIENLEAEMEEAMIKADGHSHLWIQENSKKCPKCSIPIQACRDQLFDVPEEPDDDDDDDEEEEGEGDH